MYQNLLTFQNLFVPPDPISPRELSQGLLDLNRIIQHRLSPLQHFLFLALVLFAENGRVVLSVPYEFEVSLTLMSEALDFPWRILDIQFRVTDPESGRKLFVI
ncbi:unnamed protein product [Protopolystoma xenopodis]|uniref:Mediator of RNA polymerase II transcription subunit 14 n=1 Tax=Protopolystoma xenopodis TaxID=117903 RepID=A0A3S5A7T7_9PLAT|nr:unnamed protein product [Protopolystoma xenopodis]